MKAGCWLGLLLVTGSLHGQGISAVTRPTRMAGPPQGALTGPLPAGLPAGGGGQGLVVNPNWAGAAAMFGPVLASPARPNPVPAAGPAPVVAARPVVPRVAAPVDRAEMEARVVAFQQEQARQGSPSAQLALGRRYLAGDGVERNEAVGRVWLEAAARQGAAEAQEALRRLASPGLTSQAVPAGKD